MIKIKKNEIIIIYKKIYIKLYYQIYIKRYTYY